MNKWEEMINSIIHSKVFKDYQKKLNILVKLEKKRADQLEYLQNKQEKIIAKINNRSLSIINTLLNKWRRKKIKNIDFLIEKILNKDAIYNNVKNNLKKSWREIWKEILTHYCYDLTKLINSEELKEWQDKFIENCQLLMDRRKDNEKDSFLLINDCKQLCEIIKTLVNDVCSDHEFHKKESLTIIGDNIFLRAKSNLNSKNNEIKLKPCSNLLDNNWKPEIRRQSNHILSRTDKLCWRKYVVLR